MVKTIITAVIATAALVGCATPYQMMADREVDRLCAIDGGTVVFEKVQLSPENFGPKGELFPQYRFSHELGPYGPDYALKRSTNVVAKEPVLIEKLTSEVWRKKDEKVLGRHTTYLRKGGDAFNFYHPTNYSCPAYGVTPELEPSVFGRGTQP